MPEILHPLEYIFQVSDLQESSQNIAFLLIIMGVGTGLRLTMSALKLKFLYYPLVLLTGFFAGIIIYYNQHMDYYNFSLLAEINPNNYLLIFFPVMLFHTAFSMDYHGFGQSTLQVLFLSIIGFPAQVAFASFIFHHAFVGLSYDWTWEVAITFSIICGIIESEMIVNELNKAQERVKHIQLLLQGEQLATLATATFSFRVVFEHNYGSSDTATFFILTMLWHILGIFFGMILGYLLSYVFIKTCSDIPVAVTLTMFAAFFSFYIGHIHIYQAGVVATIMTGVMLSPAKLKTTSDVEIQLTNYWDLLSLVFNTIAFVIPGIIVGLRPTYIALDHVIYVMITYIITCFSRSSLFLLTRLFLKMRHHISLKNVIVVALGPHRGAPALIIALLYRQYSPEDGQQVLTYTVMLCFISSLLNGFLMPILLTKLGMYDLTHAKAVNMRNAIANVQECRNKAIISLRMDRFIADANWPIVEESTRLAIPQLKILQGGKLGMKMADGFEYREAICLNCEEECPIKPTEKELHDLEIDAKHRILKAKLVSLWRQYDSGTLSKSSMIVLSTILQNAMERKDPWLDICELEQYWSPPNYIKKLKLFLEFILRCHPKKYEFMHLPRMRSALFKIINTLTYRLVSTFLTVLDTYFILNFALHSHWPPVASIPLNLLQAFDFFFYTIFVVEFVILIFALGYVQYFKRQFHKIDFTCNILIRTAEIMIVIYILIFESGGDCCSFDRADLFVLKKIKLMLVFKLNRLYTISEVIVRGLLHLLENHLDHTLMQYYDVGKAFIVANERTLKHLRHIVQERVIYAKLRSLLEEDRRKVSKFLGLIKKERPYIAVTIKTRHAIRQVINEMNDGINDICDEGLLDHIERKYLKASLEQAKRLLRSQNVITSSPPEHILREVPWLYEENETTSLMLKNARLVTYKSGDVMINAGDKPFGLIVLVSGFVKCIYEPSTSTIKNCRKHGALPNCDFLGSLKFEESQEDYIVSGNIIGEIGAVTMRPFDMRVVCESAVQVYYIPQRCVQKVLYELDISDRVLCKMWKCIGIRIALILLQYVSNFQGWLREKTLLYLEKAFVPILFGVEELLINDLVADVVLIEGMVMDANTRSVFYAPFYIPRTTNKLILPGTSKWNIEPEYETKLLIVPSKNAEEADIMGPAGIINDGREATGMQLYSTESSFFLPRLTKKKYEKEPEIGLKKRYRELSLSASEIESTSADTFSSDSDIPRMKIFQNKVKKAVKRKSVSRITMKNEFNCVEDVLEQGSGSEQEDIFDYDKVKKIQEKATSRKLKKRKEHERDIDTQTDLANKEEPSLESYY